MAKAFNLKQFSVDELLVLRDRVDAMLVDRVDRERRDLEARLKRLHRFKAADAEPKKIKLAAKTTHGKSAVRATKGKKVAPKYRNPENTAQTWTGRGLQPRWMREAIEASGKKVEDFRISG